jgi:hypothetical protein
MRIVQTFPYPQQLSGISVPYPIFYHIVSMLGILIPRKVGNADIVGIIDVENCQVGILYYYFSHIIYDT